MKMNNLLAMVKDSKTVILQRSGAQKVQGKSP